MTLKTRISIDETFIAKSVCAVDDRIYQWLKQCSVRNSVTDTDLTLIESPYILSDIQLNCFTYFLLPSITKVGSEPFNDKKEQGEPNNKKKKEATKMGHNVQQVATCSWKLRNNKTWNTVFCHKNQDGPILLVVSHA